VVFDLYIARKDEAPVVMKLQLGKIASQTHCKSQNTGICQ